MLNESAKSIIRILIQSGTLLKSHGLEWETWRKITFLRVTTNPLALLFWRFQMFLLFSYELFIVYRLYESFDSLLVSPERLVIHIFYAICFFFYCGNSFNHYAREDEISRFITDFLQFDQLFLPQSSKHLTKMNLFGKFLLIFLLCGIGHGIAQGPCFLYFSDNPNFIFSVVKPMVSPEMELWSKLLFALFEIWMSLMAWFASLSHTFFFFSVPFCIPLWTDLMIYRNKRAVEQPIKRFLYYRCLQCLLNQFNNCYACFSFLTIKLSSFIGLIIVMYGSIRFHGKLPIVAYLALPFSFIMGFMYIFMIFPKAGEVKEKLEVMLNGWERIGLKYLQIRNPTLKNQTGFPKTKNLQKSNVVEVDKTQQQTGVKNAATIQPNSTCNCYKLNACFIRSCPAVGFKVGIFFTCKTKSAFTYSDIVITQAINALITFK